MKQGPVAINVDFAGGKASGKMSMGGQDRPVAADLGGELFADSASQWVSIGCLPLAEGYSATFRNFALQTQKVQLMEAKVAGAETVTVPAGKFDTWKVELTSADGGSDNATLWIAKDSRATVKVSAVWPRRRRDDDGGVDAVTEGRDAILTSGGGTSSRRDRAFGFGSPLRGYPGGMCGIAISSRDPCCAGEQIRSRKVRLVGVHRRHHLCQPRP